MVKVRVRLSADGTLRDVCGDKGTVIRGRIDTGRVDRTSESEIARQQAEDDASGRKAR